jgi:alpha-D-xyloside xylohydrolase|eukprot:COSAG06_NODE_1565_length_9086_cov_34.853566_5_plen_87_part_00
MHMMVVAQYAAEKASDPLELRIYPGGDANFTLYEDDGTTMRYSRRDESSTIRFLWADSTKTLSVSDRVGRFPGERKRNPLFCDIFL